MIDAANTCTGQQGSPRAPVEVYPPPRAPGGILARVGAPEPLERPAPHKGIFRKPSGGLQVPPGAGHFKTVEAAPRQAFGGSEGLGGAEPRGNYLKSRGASTKMRASPTEPPGDPRTHQGTSPPDPFENHKPARGAQTPPQPGDAPGAQGRGR